MDSNNERTVEFLAKPPYLPNDCIGKYAPWKCANESLFIANTDKMEVRFCGDQRCKEMAAKMARDEKNIWDYKEGELFPDVKI